MTIDEKLKTLYRMVQKLNERVQYLSYFIKNDKDTDKKLTDKITDIDKELR
jgi:predicted RNase H-like nuclease (RuvC/YqgF family)